MKYTQHTSMERKTIMDNNILVAMDIVKSRTVNMENLGVLLNRINQLHAYDKVGDTFYQVQRLYNDRTATRSSDLVVRFLNELASRRSTSESVRFRLDLSNSCEVEDLYANMNQV